MTGKAMHVGPRQEVHRWALFAEPVHALRVWRKQPLPRTWKSSVVPIISQPLGLISAVSTVLGQQPTRLYAPVTSPVESMPPCGR